MVWDRDVCTADAWDLGKVLRDTGQTPLGQVCGCRAVWKALLVHHCSKGLALARYTEAERYIVETINQGEFKM